MFVKAVLIGDVDHGGRLLDTYETFVALTCFTMKPTGLAGQCTLNHCLYPAQSGGKEKTRENTSITITTGRLNSVSTCNVNDGRDETLKKFTWQRCLFDLTKISVVMNISR